MKPKFSSPGTELPARRACFRTGLLVARCLVPLLAAAAPVRAQVGFSAHPLTGLVSGSTNKASKVTSLQFGPDNRLYFTQVNGTVIACEVVRNGPGDYVALNAETISLVKNIPNYNDDGTRNFSLNTRQATGILVTGTPANPVIYVSSSDPREGAGSGATDLNLDTNSGVISRLTRNSGGVWEKVDLVRGLPRSEENHASNGLNINADGTVLYLAQGGNTNAGGPSNNFAFACETALSAAVLSIDLAAIEAMPVQTDAYGQKYVYDIPTVNDPNAGRSQVSAGSVVKWGDGPSIETAVNSGLQGVAAGAAHTLVLKSDGTVTAWGSNSSGQATVPAGLAGVVGIAAGEMHSLALKGDGTVAAWGDNTSGQATVPGGLANVQAVAAGAMHSVALKTDGTVTAWGDNSLGQATVPGDLAGVEKIAAGGGHTVALKDDGTVVAWGDNSLGQATVPGGLAGVEAIAAGGSHTVALKDDGTVVAWGDNSAGQTDVPPGLSGVVAIAAGTAHTAALKDDGTVVAWGSNSEGQTALPPGLAGVQSISAGGDQTLALKSFSVDMNDPFGGNDGLNQAKLVEGGPVQVFASGFRNPYDVLIGKTPDLLGKMYTFDNAANSGWGGYPKNEGPVPEGSPSTVTNELQEDEPGAVNNQDGLHEISQGYYGGHPNPIRANPAGAGWLRDDNGTKVYSLSPTTDWPPVPPSLADPQEGDFRMPGSVESGSIVTNTASTTGMAEYTAGNFGGEMLGNIIVTQYSANTVQRIVLNPDGSFNSSSVLLQGSSYGTPLDVTCPGPGAAPSLAGCIFVGHHSSKITVLEPNDFDSGGGTCTGTFSFAVDEDGDGYTNADELTNNSDPCSAAVLPPDRDGDFLSDLLDTDDDNDGISDSQDVFPIDALNGGNLTAPMRYDLFNELGIGFFSIGLTGVMLDPGENYSLAIDDGEIIAGGTAGLFTDPTVGAGNPHGSSNSQMNAFQFGVRVDESTGLFRVRSGLGGLLFNGTPMAAQSQGIYIGNGDQDNYIKIAVHANSGAGGIEVVHEENGTILTQQLYNESGLFSGTVVLSFLVDPIAGSVQPGYSVGAGPVIDVGPPLLAGGKILDAIRGNPSMAVGLLATTGDVSTPTFNATWDYFEVEPVASTAAAMLTVNSNAGSITSSSTNTTGSFQLENLSTGGQKIVSVTVDLSTALLPDVVFDPAGTAGDTDGKAFQLDAFNGTGTPAGTFEAPHDGIGSEDGYDVLRITCGPGVDFGPGDLLTFSADVDPTSVKGVPGPGPMHAASVSGLELIGATVTVTFDDGTVRQIRNAGLSGPTNTNKTSRGVLAPDNLPAPVISVPGQTSPFTTATQPTVRVVGLPGADVQVWTFNTALYLEGVAGGGYDIDPYEANSVIAYGITDAVIGESGYVDVPVTLSYSEETGGINYVAALALDETTGRRSSSSGILTIDYDPSGGGSSDALIRINAGGGSYTDGSGQAWSADTGFSSGSTSTFANEIAGTSDDTLYQTFRYDDSPSSPLDYSFAVPNGNYEVRLHFAETWSGVTAAGQRVFDVLVEGQLEIDNLDIFAVAGPNVAHVETVQAAVTDGQLTIGLRHVVQNPFICAIEVFSLGATGPDEEAPTAPAPFTMTNLKAGSVTLTWAPATDNVGVSGYRIFRDSVEIATTSQLSYNDTGLIPSTEYDYEIEAYDAAGNVSARTPLTVTTPADQEDPSVPGNLKGVAGNSLAILTWTASTDDAGIAGYRIYRDGSLIATVSGTEYTDNGLTNGTLYDYEVVALDAAGKTSAPAAVSVRPRALGPAVLRVNCGGLEFTDLAGNVWAADYGFNTGVAEASTGDIAGTEDDVLYQNRRFDRSHGAELKYTFPLADGDYELRLHFAEVWSGASSAPGVRVFDVKVEDQVALDNFDIFAQAGFATALSVPVPVTVTGGQITIEFLHMIQNPTIAGIEIYALEGPPPDTEAPEAPGGLAVTGTTPGSISLSWNAASDNVGVTAYRILRNGSLVATIPDLSFTDTGLLADTQYDYAVEAVDASLNVSPPASIQAGTAPDSQPPTAPGSLTGSPGNGVAILSWTASSDDGAVAAYRIYRDGVLVDTTAATGYTDAGLTNGTSYAYEVTAIDTAGNESDPAAVSVTPRALGPAILRVNVGSTSSFLDPSGETWVPDFGYNTGYTELTTNPISGTDMPALYQKRRIDRSTGAELKYQFTIPNGDYEVRLHFAEVWTGAYGAGIRVFDVLMEGQMALDDLDVFAEAGANQALVKAVPVNVADGQLTIDFIHVIQNPNISGIEVYPVMSSGSGETEPPTAPGNLAVSTLTTGSVGLTWSASTDNTGVSGYRVFRNGNLIHTATGLSYEDTGLAAGTEYDYEVIAFDAAGNTSPPAAVSAITLVPDTEAPSIPGDLAATPGLSHVVLSWEASTDNEAVTGYRVLRDGAEVATVATPGYTDSGLASATEYDYEVLAFDAVGNLSSPAQVTTATLTDTEAPETPANFAAVPGHVNVSLSWSASTDNAGVTGYRVYRNGVLLDTVEETVFEDSGLIPDTLYAYQVAAVDSAGNASAPAEASATTLEDGSPPSVPGGLEAAAGDSGVQLSWAASTDNVAVAAYEVRRDGVLVATVPVPGYSDTGLVNGTLYTYLVRAVDAAGNASADAADSATPRVLGGEIARVNAGGLAFTDSAGNEWWGDQGFVFGNTATTSVAIAGTEDDALYQTERYDSSPGGANLEFALAVDEGQYEVKLHFAETYAAITGAGQRVFDVQAEGNLAIDNMDIFARAGANAACTVAFPVQVTDGTLNITFHHVVQNPKVCGIEVHEILPAVEPPPTFEEWLEVNGLAGQTAGDADQGGLDNFEEYELQMDPNDPNDDLEFSLSCSGNGSAMMIALPALKPIGNYHLHRSGDLADIGDIANRIDTVTKAEIEAMTSQQREEYSVGDPSGGPRAFYKLYFEPVSD